MTYTLQMSDETGFRESAELEASNHSEARTLADSKTTAWVRSGDWGEDGASILAWWCLLNDDGLDCDNGEIVVEIEPNQAEAPTN